MGREVCPGGELNPQGPFGPTDFQFVAFTNFATRALTDLVLKRLATRATLNIRSFTTFLLPI
jgi:hypothetical protein